MTEQLCTSTNRLVDDVLNCELPAEHANPTVAYPQGTPHQSSAYLDVLTGEPWRWWG